MRLALCVILFMATNSSFAADKKEACLSAAMDAHFRAKTQLHETAGVVMSPEAQIMERRLDEAYCLQQVRCLLEDTAGEERAMMASAIFSSCLGEDIK